MAPEALFDRKYTVKSDVCVFYIHFDIFLSLFMFMSAFAIEDFDFIFYLFIFIIYLVKWNVVLLLVNLELLQRYYILVKYCLSDCKGCAEFLKMKIVNYT